MTSYFYFVFVTLAFTPEILALFGFTLFKDQSEAWVGKYLLDESSKLKPIDYTPPRRLALSWVICAAYSVVFVLVFQKQNFLLNTATELQAILLLPVVLCVLPLLIGQLAGFAMISRVAILCTIERLPRYVLRATRIVFLSFLSLIRRL